MASIDCVLDTTPMAQEINKVSSHVKATTAAVVTMQTAVVLAEAKAADHVCDNVNKGFYTLIRSQISQKTAKLQSEVDSHLMQLNQQKKQLFSIKGRMERDYNMISHRYLKLFNGLNANLKQRIFELDRPVMDFAIRDIDKVSNRTKNLTGIVPITQLESLSMSQKIMASNIKHRGLNVINSMSRFLGQMEEQKKLTDRILLEKRNKPESLRLLVPVIISEMNYDRFDNKNIEIAVSDVVLNKQSQALIKNTVMPEIANLEWNEKPTTDKEVQNEFSNLLASFEASKRIKDMTNRLFMANDYQHLQNQ